jgi:hypothetical protein
MAYTQTITEANTYFSTSNHIRSYDWTQYTTAERTAGLAQAQRELETYLNRDLYDPASDDRYRDDYAHFEQTLFILDETVRTRGSETGAELVETVDTEQRDKYYGVTISPMAQRYFAMTRRKWVRG